MQLPAAEGSAPQRLPPPPPPPLPPKPPPCDAPPPAASGLDQITFDAGYLLWNGNALQKGFDCTRGCWVVGFFDPSGRWVPVMSSPSDFDEQAVVKAALAALDVADADRAPGAGGKTARHRGGQKQPAVTARAASEERQSRQQPAVAQWHATLPAQATQEAPSPAPPKQLGASLQRVQPPQPPAQQEERQPDSQQPSQQQEPLQGLFVPSHPPRSRSAPTKQQAEQQLAGQQPPPPQQQQQPPQQEQEQEPVKAQPGGQQATGAHAASFEQHPPLPEEPPSKRSKQDGSPAGPGASTQQEQQQRQLQARAQKQHLLQQQQLRKQQEEQQAAAQTVAGIFCSPVLRSPMLAAARSLSLLPQTAPAPHAASAAPSAAAPASTADPMAVACTVVALQNGAAGAGQLRPLNQAAQQPKQQLPASKPAMKIGLGKHKRAHELEQQAPEEQQAPSAVGAVVGVCGAKRQPAGTTALWMPARPRAGRHAAPEQQQPGQAADMEQSGAQQPPPRPLRPPPQPQRPPRPAKPQQPPQEGSLGLRLGLPVKARARPAGGAAAPKWRKLAHSSQHPEPPRAAAQVCATAGPAQPAQLQPAVPVRPAAAEMPGLPLAPGAQLSQAALPPQQCTVLPALSDGGSGSSALGRHVRNLLRRAKQKDQIKQQQQQQQQQEQQAQGLQQQHQALQQDQQAQRRPQKEQMAARGERAAAEPAAQPAALPQGADQKPLQLVAGREEAPQEELAREQSPEQQPNLQQPLPGMAEVRQKLTQQHRLAEQQAIHALFASSTEEEVAVPALPGAAGVGGPGRVGEEGGVLPQPAAAAAALAAMAEAVVHPSLPAQEQRGQAGRQAEGTAGQLAARPAAPPAVAASAWDAVSQAFAAPDAAALLGRAGRAAPPAKTGWCSAAAERVVAAPDAGQARFEQAAAGWQRITRQQASSWEKQLGKPVSESWLQDAEEMEEMQAQVARLVAQPPSLSAASARVRRAIRPPAAAAAPSPAAALRRKQGKQQPPHQKRKQHAGSTAHAPVPVPSASSRVATFPVTQAATAVAPVQAAVASASSTPYTGSLQMQLMARAQQLQLMAQAQVLAAQQQAQQALSQPGLPAPVPAAPSMVLQYVQPSPLHVSMRPGLSAALAQWQLQQWQQQQWQMQQWQQHWQQQQQEAPQPPEAAAAAGPLMAAPEPLVVAAAGPPAHPQ